VIYKKLVIFLWSGRWTKTPLESLKLY